MAALRGTKDTSEAKCLHNSTLIHTAQTRAWLTQWLRGCGLDHVHLFTDKTHAQRFAKNIFDDVFTACLDITFNKELDEHFKT